MALTIEKVKLKIFEYGYIPVLTYLKGLEEKEDYENSQIVYSALKEAQEMSGIILTTETTDEAIEKLYNEFVKEFKKDPKIYEVNLPAYIEECRVELENEIKI